MDNEKKITKIVISKEDELTDIVAAILDSGNERIVLTFAEETDLLISPINLKVLLETADEKEKLLIAQIIKNPTGIRNANLAGLSAIDSPQFPEEDVWEVEEINRTKRLSPPKKETPKKKEEDVKMPEEKELSDFQKRIDDTIARSKARENTPAQEENDILITLDEDLPSSLGEKFEDFDEEKKGLEDKEPDLSNIDFSQKTKPLENKPKTEKKNSDFGKKIKAIPLAIAGFFKKIPVPTKFKKTLPFIAISILAVAILMGVIFLRTGLLVKVRIYVEAKDVEIEDIFTGDENIKEIDFENFKIPVKTEAVEKARSTNIRATGTAFRGEKAQGQINLTYLKDDCQEDTATLDLPAGQSVSSGGKTYTLDSAASLKCNTPQEKSITAIEVGEEYNLAAGQLFAIQGYSTNQVFGLNNAGALTGGSKEEYTILSKADVDAAVSELSGIAIGEGESELRDMSGTWEIIADSLTSLVLPDSTKTDVAIGAEAGDVNVSIQTRSTASFFLKEGFDNGVEELLTQKAKDENLFETDSDWDLELDEEIEKEVSVVESNAQGISIKLVARSTVKPKVNTEDILDRLRTLNWEEGNDYLKSLDFSEKETRIEFFPEWFPEWLKLFPKRQGGVLITIANAD